MKETIHIPTSYPSRIYVTIGNERYDYRELPEKTKEEVLRTLIRTIDYIKNR